MCENRGGQMSTLPITRRQRLFHPSALRSRADTTAPRELNAIARYSARNCGPICFRWRLRFWPIADSSRRPLPIRSGPASSACASWHQR